MDKKLNSLKIDRKVFSVVSLDDKDDYHDYWLEKTAIERLKHIETLRRINYGNAATARLQRIFEYTQG